MCQTEWSDLKCILGVFTSVPRWTVMLLPVLNRSIDVTDWWSKPLPSHGFFYGLISQFPIFSLISICPFFVCPPSDRKVAFLLLRFSFPQAAITYISSCACSCNRPLTSQRSSAQCAAQAPLFLNLSGLRVLLWPLLNSQRRCKSVMFNKSAKE